MLEVPKHVAKANQAEAKRGLEKHFNQEMERILNENASKDRYWILGKVRFPEELGGKVGRVFLEASDTQPMLIKDAFLYEVDNRRGVKTLLWVMNPGNELVMPTLGKKLTISTDNRA